jgi:hypothetical protein
MNNGIEISTCRVFMFPVKARGRNDMLPIIKEWTLNGTTIYSDYWKTYHCLDKEGYVYLKVNHRQ